VPGQADIDLGQILVILTLNRLLAPQPLDQIQPWLADTVLPQVLDGRSARATNATHLDADQTLQLFKGQDRVEKRFRTAKGPLRVRPRFVRRDARIEGLVLVTMLAVLVDAILERLCRQHGLALSADKLLAPFAGLQAVDLLWADGRQQRRVAEASAWQVNA